MAGELWSLWELMGATTGPTRGDLLARLPAAASGGWELALGLATVGCDGYWPHAMALWRARDAHALHARLGLGLDDGLDESGVRWGTARLLRTVSGSIVPGHGAFLVERVVTDARSQLEALAGPDLVLAEVLAPWQGVALWSAADLGALAAREYAGIGAGSLPGVVEASGWWAVVPPARDMA